MLKYSHFVVLAFLSSSFVILFQNCSADLKESSPMSSYQSVYCSSEENCEESFDENSNESTSVENGNSSTLLPPSVTIGLPSTSSGEVNPKSEFYNFVAGDELSCQVVISDFLRKEIQDPSVIVIYTPRCSMGGGCGVSCGVPDGQSCRSAYPNAFGACLDQKGVETAIGHNRQIYAQKSGFNYVAGDKVTCDKSIMQTFRVRVGRELLSSNHCKTGGGCGLSCGKPNGTSCISANPRLPGACFDYDEFRNLQ